MIDFVIFKLAQSVYAIEIEKVQRIIQTPELTQIPSAHEYIDGMMSYESRVIKVVNLRKMMGLATFDEEMLVLFDDLKKQHTAWVDALKDAVYNDHPFTKTTNPHMCQLGKWLDSFTSYDDHVSSILKDLNANHKALHNSAIGVLEMLKTDKDAAKKDFEVRIKQIYHKTLASIDLFIAEFDIVAASLQKLLLYHYNGADFAIKVDSIVDIVHLDESVIQKSSDDNIVSEYLELNGVIEINGELVNVIKEVKLPQK